MVRVLPFSLFEVFGIDNPLCQGLSVTGGGCREEMLKMSSRLVKLSSIFVFICLEGSVLF